MEGFADISVIHITEVLSRVYWEGVFACWEGFPWSGGYIDVVYLARDLGRFDRDRVSPCGLGFLRRAVKELIILAIVYIANYLCGPDWERILPRRTFHFPILSWFRRYMGLVCVTTTTAAVTFQSKWQART